MRFAAGFLSPSSLFLAAAMLSDAISSCKIPLGSYLAGSNGGSSNGVAFSISVSTKLSRCCTKTSLAFSSADPGVVDR